MADDALLTVSQVCRSLPGARGAAHVTPSTVTRWILTGCPARDGVRVKLAATRAGGRWLVRVADLDAFFRLLAAEPSGPVLSPAPVTERKANERTQRANESVIRRGA